MSNWETRNRVRKEPKNTTVTITEFKEYFARVSSNRCEVDPKKLKATLCKIPDISQTREASKTQFWRMKARKCLS